MIPPRWRTRNPCTKASQGEARASLFGTEPANDFRDFSSYQGIQGRAGLTSLDHLGLQLFLVAKAASAKRVAIVGASCGVSVERDREAHSTDVR